MEVLWAFLLLGGSLHLVKLAHDEETVWHSGLAFPAASPHWHSPQNLGQDQSPVKLLINSALLVGGQLGSTKV